MLPSAFTLFLQQFGVPLGLVVFFIWRDWKRESSMSIRIEKLEQFQKERLEAIAIESTKVLATNNIVIAKVLELLERIERNYASSSNASNNISVKKD